LQKLGKIPFEGILGGFWDILGNFGFWGIYKILYFFIFFKLKKIMFEQNSGEKNYFLRKLRPIVCF
jgi:hypothetical protein